MKKTLLFVTIGASMLLNAQLNVQTLQLTTNDLVFDQVTQKIYASIPSANGSNGNSIGIINPRTNTLEKTVFIGSEPTVLAISDNGQYIYSGFSASSTIRRFDVATQTAGLQFTLGFDSSTGPNYAEDVEVMPGQPGTIAVSRKNNGFSPRHEGVAIYDNGVMRPTTTPDHTGSNKIEFMTSTSLIGYNNESTEFGLRKMAINNAGVAVVSVTQNAFSGFYLDFFYKDNRVYGFNGAVLDVTGTPFVSGQFSNVNGPGVFDSTSSSVAFASFDYSGNIIFKRFNPETFLLRDNLPITQTSGQVKSMITCGSGCYAFNTTDNKVVIIQDALLGISEANAKKISIFPNPTVDFISVKNDIKITEVVIYDLSGRMMMKVSNAIKINLSNLKAGVYVAKVTDINGNVFSEKIIKK